MKKAPATTSNPGPMVPNKGPYKQDMGALPEKTKRHSVPAHKETRGDKAKVNAGPSHPGMGNIADRTDSHNVPAHAETRGDVMMHQPKSGEDRLSPAVENQVPKSWKKKSYDMSLPTADPEA